MRRQTERERRLAHARSGTDHHQRARLQPRQQAVELLVPGRRARYLVTALSQLLEVCEALFEQGRDVGEGVRGTPLCDREDRALGLIHRLVDVIAG